MSNVSILFFMDVFLESPATMLRLAKRGHCSITAFKATHLMKDGSLCVCFRALAQISSLRRGCYSIEKIITFTSLPRAS